MRWMISFVAASVGGIAVVLLAVWGMNGFDSLGLDTAGTVAIVLGIVVTSALGVGLMALIFYSDRSDADEEAYRHAADGAGESRSADRRNVDGDHR
jgi:hypothetical protein